MLTDEFINKLITLPKNAVKSERRSMIEINRSERNRILLESIDKQYSYKMFMRRSTEFIEDFSIGLIWTNANKFTDITRDLLLLRCQGPHDGKKPLEFDIHHDYHTHILSENDILEKRFSKPSNRELTSDFHSFEEALEYFINLCQISKLENYIEMPWGDQCYGQLIL